MKHSHDTDCTDYPIANCYAVPRFRQTATRYSWTYTVPACPHCGASHEHGKPVDATPWQNPLTRSAGVSVAKCHLGLYELIVDLHPPTAVLEDMPESLRQVAMLGFPANARAIADNDGEEM